MEQQLAYTIKQTAEILNLSVSTIEGMIKRQELPHMRFGARRGTIRVTRKTIEEVLGMRKVVR